MSHDDPQLRHIAHAYATTVHAAQGSTRDRVIAVLDSGHGVLSDQATFYVEISRARDQAIVLTDNIEQLVETLEDHTGETLTALEAIGEEPDPLHDIGRQVRANMRAPGSPLAKGVPPDPARREATRWAAALDEWCEQRDRHQEAAARAGTHPSQHPGHDELMGRLLDIGRAEPFPESLRARFDDERSRHEALGQVPALLRRQAARIERAVSLWTMPDQPSGVGETSRVEGESTMDPRYESLRDELGRIAVEGRQLLDRGDLGLAALVEECDRLRATLERARRVTEADEWVRVWEAQSASRDRSRAVGMLERASAILSDPALPESWRQALQDRIDRHAARKEYATLKARQEELKQATAAGTHWFEHPEADAFIADARKLAGTAALPAANSNSLRGLVAEYDEWKAAQTAAALEQYATLMGRREELKRAAAATGTRWFEHPETDAFIADARKLAGTAALPAANSNSLRGLVAEYDEWKAAQTAAALEQYATLMGRREELKRAAAATGTRWFEHPEAAEFIEAVGKLAGTGALPAANSNSLRGLIAEYDEWQAAQTAAALERYATLKARQGQLKRAAAAGTHWFEHPETDAFIADARKLAGTGALSAADSNSLAGIVAEYDEWQAAQTAAALERYATLMVRQGQLKQAAAATGTRWFEHPEAAEFIEDARKLAGTAALPAAESNSLQEFVTEYDEWQASQTAAALERYATLKARQGQLKRAAATGTHWFEHPETDAFIADARKLAGTAALPAANSNSLRRARCRVRRVAGITGRGGARAIRDLDGQARGTQAGGGGHRDSLVRASGGGRVHRSCREAGRDRGVAGGGE